MSNCCAAVGISKEAIYLEKTSQLHYKEHETAVSNPRSAAYDCLIDISLECRETNWGNDGEAPVEYSTIGLVEQFIRSLPSYIQMPEISPEPDGSIYLEWYQQPRRIMSISINEQGLVSWAVLYGQDDPRGSFIFIGNDIPVVILTLISKVSG